MAKLIRLTTILVCLFAAPLAAQLPPFMDGPAFGGSKLFSGLLAQSDRPFQASAHGYFSAGFTNGDQGAGKFLSSLDTLASINPNAFSDPDAFKESIDAFMDAISELKESKWGMRSRVYGMALHDQNSSLELTREEMTSLWAEAADIDSHIFGFDVRRAVVDRLSASYFSSTKNSIFFYGGTFRVERWSFGSAFREMGALLPDNSYIGCAKQLLDFKDATKKCVSYGLDAVTGVEIAGSIRLALQTDRLATKRLWDVEEKPQLRAGVQIDIGSLAKLAIESDINEAMRMPYPVMQKTALASLKVKANSTLTFALGAERKTMDGQSTARFGLNAWITGKSNHFGVGFQIGQDIVQAPWGAAWHKAM
ncbi:MAG: hypothetical protein LBC63_02125 [Holophagales bacterium]|jgi:hypothetical protein|nr:hypothetical protein [Holophagales bacterium]